MVDVVINTVKTRIRELTALVIAWHHMIRILPKVRFVLYFTFKGIDSQTLRVKKHDLAKTVLQCAEMHCNKLSPLKTIADIKYF